MNQLFRFLIFCIIFLSNAHTKDIQATFELKTKGFVTDFVYDRGMLFVANDIGTIEIFNLKQQKSIAEITVEPYTTAQNKLIYPKIISIDRHKDQLLFVTTAQKGFREVWLHDGMKLKKIASLKDKLSIKKARFIDDNNYMFGTLAHEMILYNNKDSYQAYKVHLEQSTFSDLALSEDKKLMITASESGRVTLTEVKTGKVLRVLESQNVDHIYKIAMSKGSIITAGQDRRVGVYPKDNPAYYIKSDFLVYCVGLSPSSKIAIYSSGENHNLQLFNVRTKKKLDRLIGHYATPHTIKFINEKELITAGDEKKIFYWKL